MSALSVQIPCGAISFDSVTTNITGSGTPAPLSVVPADIDGDGRPDIAVGNHNSTNVVIFQNVSQY